MSNRGIDAPLAVQMDRLKKTMQTRDKRRDQDRQQRLVNSAADDPYVQSTRVRPTGGVNLGPGAAAQAAVLSAAALEGPTPIRCELCQANFRNEAILRQHEEGPAHKKAVAKDKARREREAWMENPSAAANALGAAAWLNGDGAMRKQASSRGSQRRQGGRGMQGMGAFNGKEEPVRSQGQSHAELIKKARQANEPISIDGWVPPPLEPTTEATSGDVADEPLASTFREDDLAADHAKAAVQCDSGQDQEDQAPGGGVADNEGALVAYGESSEEDGSDSEESEGPPTKFESFF